MKKILILLVISISLLQSCKKDETTSTTNDKLETSKFNPNNIEDMNAYLSDFIKNMKSTSKESTSMSLEDAQWHLTACLNYQFCNANTGRTDMLYDTIVTTISIDDDIVTMTDINSSFQEISTEVSRIYNSYDMPNKQIVFIYSVIDTENLAKGEATVKSIMATTERNDYYYFDEWDYWVYEIEVFNNSNGYHWRAAAGILEYYINYIGTQYIEEDYYYVGIETVTYNYENYPINNPAHTYNYRLYYCEGLDIAAYLNGSDMAFYLDSYLGLACRSLTNNGSMINATVYDLSKNHQRDHNWEILYHDLEILYGNVIYNNQSQD